MFFAIRIVPKKNVWGRSRSASSSSGFFCDVGNFFLIYSKIEVEILWKWIEFDKFELLH